MYPFTTGSPASKPVITQLAFGPEAYVNAGTAYAANKSQFSVTGSNLTSAIVTTALFNTGAAANVTISNITVSSDGVTATGDISYTGAASATPTTASLTMATSTAAVDINATEMLSFSFKGITTAVGEVTVSGGQTAADLSGQLTLVVDETLRPATVGTVPYTTALAPSGTTGTWAAPMNYSV